MQGKPWSLDGALDCTDADGADKFKKRKENKNNFNFAKIVNCDSSFVDCASNTIRSSDNSRRSPK